MADCIRIKNWDRWQSYRKDRGQPPWIKVHRRLLQNQDWAELTDAQRGQLVVMWILAADRDGVIMTPTRRQSDAKANLKAASRLIQRLGMMDSAPDLQLFAELGFIELDANVTPTWRQGDDPEAETDTETETETEKIERPARAREGRVITAQSSDLDMIAPTDKQMIMLHDHANAAGTTVDEVAAELGIPVAGINVTRIMDRCDEIRDQRKAARASPKTFAQQRRSNTENAIAEVMREITDGNHHADQQPTLADGHQPSRGRS